jgi:hypothetical protein
MAKAVSTVARLFMLNFVRIIDGQRETETIKGGISAQEAESLQKHLVAQNGPKAKQLLAKIREEEEKPDSAEKRGIIKKLQNELNELKYPTKHSDFEIVRDLRSAEQRKAEEAATADRTQAPVEAAPAEPAATAGKGKKGGE